jgi:group II intron reverse transcriptase/maturase
MRDRRDPTRQPSQAKTQGIRPKAETKRSREGVRGARSTEEGGDKPLEGRGPASVVAVNEGKREGMPESVKRTEASNPEKKVRKLQRSLWVGAKRSKTRRYHALYDRIWRSDFLQEAWNRVRKNGGAAGVDEQTLAAIEASGVAEFLKDIQSKLQAGRYRPSPVRRRYIEKADGKQRPLGIPTVRDRVVQMATKLVIEPIFEADFLPCSYGFRPRREATQALEAIRKAGNQGYNFVLDADIRAYFDSIDQKALMLRVERRISDRRVLKLIRKWLKAGVMEDGTVRESLAGTPQGGVISPLLANIYLDVLDGYWDQECKELGVLVRYADDFVVMCKTESKAKEARREVEKIMTNLGLSLHPEKTRLVNLRRGKEGFIFLGCAIRKRRSVLRNPRLHFMQRWPSPRAMKKVQERVHELTTVRRNGAKNLNELIAGLNPVLRGWGNYFCSGNADGKFNRVDGYVYRRVTDWMRRRGGQRSRSYRDEWPTERLHETGLHRLQGRVSYPTQASLVRPSVSCVREIRTHSLKGGFGIGLN